MMIGLRDMRTHFTRFGSETLSFWLRHQQLLQNSLQIISEAKLISRRIITQSRFFAADIRPGLYIGATPSSSGCMRSFETIRISTAVFLPEVVAFSVLLTRKVLPRPGKMSSRVSWKWLWSSGKMRVTMWWHNSSNLTLLFRHRQTEGFEIAE